MSDGKINPAEPFTPEDVELVARALHGGNWEALCKALPRAAEICRERARRVLAALAEAGRLREPGGEWQWGYRCAISSCKEPHVVQGERSARSLAGRAVAGASAVRRWVGPWLPAPAVSPGDVNG